MRIHIPLSPSLLTDDPAKRCAEPLMVKIGGDLVLIELQGELDCEGDGAGQVIGILGLARLDKPTLHLGAHHLLHGKIANMPRPLAVIRPASDEPDESEEEVGESESEAEGQAGDATVATATTPLTSHLAPPTTEPPFGPSPTPTRPTASSSALPSHLLPPQSSPYATDSPSASRSALNAGDIFSSSPVGPPSLARDYSSDLSSPVRPGDGGEQDTPVRAGKRKHPERDLARTKKGNRREKVPRTREYEVVGLIRKKVVFALRWALRAMRERAADGHDLARPEPIVHATALPD